MIINQALLFLIFSINGCIIGLLFDFFRILRKSFKTKNIITYIEDIIFWILSGILTLYTIFTFNNGEIRFFIFVGIGLGIVLYMLIISSYFVTINTSILNFIISSTKKFITFFKKIFKKGGFCKLK